MRRGLIVAAAGLLLAGCASLKKPAPHPVVNAMEPVSAGVLAEVSREVRGRFGPGKSGFVLLEENSEAFKWKLAMIDSAQRSIDMQYYLWERDVSGTLLFDRLLDAAERGVRVRVLVDDFLFDGDERNVAVVSHHPNLEIRIFNPRILRGNKFAKTLGFVMKFGETNRRMHNKAFVADGRIAIVGGRNVGDHYYGFAEEYDFVDLEVLTTGAVVDEVAEGFDEFWNSEAAYPGVDLWRSADAEDAEELIAEYQKKAVGVTELAHEAGFPRERRDWTRDFRGLSNQWHAGTGTFFHDEPVTDPKAERGRFLDEIRALPLPGKLEEVTMVSPYLIPDETFLANIERNVNRGARVRILAPSMGANNQSLVHSKYRQYRRKLIELGAELYELREDGGAAIRAFTDTPPAGSETVGLHLKGFVRDRKTTFIGSLNMDPRSVQINTEGGMWIESPGLAEEVAEYFDILMLPENAWRVTMDENGKLRWESRGEVLTRQPAPSEAARMKDFFYGLLPIKGQL